MENPRETNRVVLQDIHSQIDSQSSTLREKLIAAQKPSTFDSMRLYVPAGRLREIISECDIKSELRMHKVNLSDLEPLEKFIRFRANKIFATLVYSGLTDKIEDFLQSEFDDKQLPVEFDVVAEHVEDLSTQGSQLLPVFRSWKAVQILHFCDCQWRFNAFKIDTFTFNKEASWTVSHLPEQMIFPFNVLGRPKRTGFNQVCRIEISSSNITLNRSLIDFRPGTQTWALKQSLQDVEHIRQPVNAWEDNSKEFQRMKQLSYASRQKSALNSIFGKRVIELQAVFQRGSTLYMLLPWAYGGSLHDLLYSNERCELPLWWIRREITVLVGAVSLLGIANCCHGDLKPDNILIFGDEGFGREMVIADFGLAKIAKHETLFSGPQPNAIMGSPRYAPPEADQNHPRFHKSLSPKYDTWSLGCILLELIIWVRCGRKTLRDFNEKIGGHRVEKFWKFDSPEYQIHPVVVKYIEEVGKELLPSAHSGPDEDYLYKLLVKVKELMLVIDREKRISALDLFDGLIRDGMVLEWKGYLANLCADWRKFAHENKIFLTKIDDKELADALKKLLRK